MMHSPPGNRRRIFRWTFVGLGTAAMLFGVAYPLPSFFHRQEARAEYERNVVKYRQQLAEFQEKLKPGEITRDYRRRQLNDLNRRYDEAHNAFASQVNLAVDAHRHDRWLGLSAAIVGICMVVFTFKFTAVRTSHLDQMTFEFDG